MIERDWFESELSAGVGSDQVFPEDGRRLLGLAGHYDRVFERRQPLLEVTHGGLPGKKLAAIRVRVHGEQDCGFDLGEAIQDRVDAKIWRAARPDGAQAGGSQERHHRFGDVRHVRNHPVAAPDPISRNPAATEAT